MKEILFTEKTRSLLQSAGWFPERDVQIFIAESDGELLPSASKVLREFGNLSIHGESHEWLTFGPEFDFGDDTILSERTVSLADLAEEKAVWKHLSKQIGEIVASVAWKEGQDLHSLAVSGNGSIFCATWFFDEPTQMINASFIKLADSINAYLNFWLDPTEATRSELHYASPVWEHDAQLSYQPVDPT